MLRRLSALPRGSRWGLALLVILGLFWGLALPLAAPALLRWGLAKVEAGLGGHRIAFTRAEFAPWRLALRIEGLRLEPARGETLAALERLDINLDALGSLRHRALALDLLRAEAPRARLSLLREGTSNWSPLLLALQSGEASPKDASPPRLRVALLQIERGRLDFSDARSQPARSSFADALQLELRELSTLPEERGAHQLVARTGLGARLSWRGEFSLQPLQAQGELQAEGLELARLWALLPQPPLRTQAPAGRAGFALRYAAALPQGQAPQLRLSDLKLQLDDFALQGLQAQEPALRLPQLRLEGGSLDLQQRRLQLGQLRLQGGHLHAALAADGALDLLDWLPPAEGASATSPRWQIGLDALDVQGLALRMDEAGFARPQRFTLAALNLGLALQVETGDAPQLHLKGLRAKVQDLRAGDWLQLAQAQLESGELDLGARRLALGPIALQGLRLQMERAADGSLPLLAALQRRSAPASEIGPAWDLQLGMLQLREGQLQVDDAAAQPRTRWQLEKLAATLDGKAWTLDAAAQLASGGRLSARGALRPQLDLQLKLDALALPPLQALLAPFTPLKLASGRIGAEGRLRVGKAWSFDGRARLDALRLDEAGGPFFALAALEAPRLRLSPTQLDLGRIDSHGLQAKLLFDKQRQLNWVGLWKSPASSGEAAAAPPRIRLERLRLRDTALDFADLSLILPFAARIHGGEGEFVGLDTAPGSAPAQLRFEGQVDEFGAAQAAGSLQPLAPTGFSDVRVQFRNVEMTRLTPYAATFAGRRIASGKLDLDLEYRLRDRQLEGNNRVVMRRLQLGEKVDSPDASSLPLDLAIALLEDADGVIDLGLPVSGSLDEPKFSVGGLVWKVVVNVLTKVVSSPFRALGALLGGEGEPADAIAFAPGSAKLAPPEREKLKRLAEALAKRPGLALRLPAGYAPARDAEALKTAQLRRALGFADDERLLDLGDASTQQALMRLARQRLGEATVNQLQQRHAMAQPAPPPSALQRLTAGVQQLTGGAPAPLSEAERAQFAGQPLTGLLWARLLAAESLAPDSLSKLALARTEALASELAQRGLSSDRLRRAEPGALKDAATSGPLQLPLGAEPMRQSGSSP